jgi:Tfp pilus assembly protein PilX
MEKLTKTINNEQGFVLVASLMMLMVLMIIGIAATNTTTLELQISGNDKLAKQTFYQAEGVVAEAVRVVGNDSVDPSKDLEDDTLYTWLRLDPATDGVLTTGSGGTEVADVHADAIWSSSLTLPTAEMAGAFRGIAPGGSLDVETSRIHLYDLYGRSQQNNALAIIKVGYRIAF